MAHFAELDENDVVLRVVVIANKDTADANGNEVESIGVSFCQSLFGANTKWKQTSYNSNFRKRYAGVGYTYRADLDAFVAPKPTQYPSWVFDNEIAAWVPPYPKPTDAVYTWNETTVSWDLVPKPYPSWVLRDNLLDWIAPIPYPSDGKIYKWDEPTLSWVEVPT